MLVTIFAAIVSNVVTSFSLIRLFLTSDLDYDKLSIAIINNAWNVAMTLPVIISFYLSSDINSKSIKVMEIVSQKMLDCKNPIIMKKVTLFPLFFQINYNCIKMSFLSCWR